MSAHSSSALMSAGLSAFPGHQTAGTAGLVTAGTAGVPGVLAGRVHRPGGFGEEFGGHLLFLHAAADSRDQRVNALAELAVLFAEALAWRDQIPILLRELETPITNKPEGQTEKGVVK